MAGSDRRVVRSATTRRKKELDKARLATRSSDTEKPKGTLGSPEDCFKNERQ